MKPLIFMTCLIYGILGFQTAHSFSVQPHQDPVHVKVIVPFKMDLVWQWSLRALSKYNVSYEDFANKSIRTAWIKEPFNTKLFDVYNYFPYFEELKTRLRIRVMEGDIPEITVINIFKDFKSFKDLIHGWTKIESDGIEEYVVGYRIRQLAYYHYIIAGRKKEN
jgi:hypothetical protein